MNVLEKDRRLVMKLMNLAYLVQCSTEYCVFINYSGHVDSLDISIRESRKNYSNELAKTHIYGWEQYYEYYKEYQTKKEKYAALKAKIDLFKKILTDYEIDYSMCERETEVNYRYSF